MYKIKYQEVYDKPEPIIIRAMQSVPLSDYSIRAAHALCENYACAFFILEFLRTRELKIVGSETDTLVCQESIIFAVEVLKHLTRQLNYESGGILNKEWLEDYETGFFRGISMALIGNRLAKGLQIFVPRHEVIQIFDELNISEQVNNYKIHNITDALEKGYADGEASALKRQIGEINGNFISRKSN